MAEASMIRSALLANHGITGIFTLRHGGISPPPFDSQNFGAGLGDSDSNIAQNLLRLKHHAALSSLPHQAMQVHQTGILWCKGRGKTHTSHADVLLANQAATAVAVRTADCLPILLADPEQGIVAAVHAGWRGTAAGVVQQAIHAMQTHGAKPGDILASLGPCIGHCCFSTGHDTATALANSITGATKYISHQPAEIHADLREINRLQLQSCGIIDVHIEASDTCTACDAERFFSFRRDAQLAGRQLAVVAVPSST